ncbi:MAG: ribosome-associated translation inhibitor RaiA [Lachnospiraceae bacterium]|nr:ribosome-associated translation inhibitor RaiA [Lachnospiraceae bacterium]
MEYKITGNHMFVSEDVRDYIQKRFSKFEKFFKEDTDFIFTLSRVRDTKKVEITIPARGTTIRAEESNIDLYAAIDLLQEVVERQIQKYRRKVIDRHQNAPSASSLFTDNQSDWDVEEDDEIKIVKSKRFAIKPMDPEEACFQMDMLGHNFYVFYNSETDLVSVVYKRKDGYYGLIEPEY